MEEIVKENEELDLAIEEALEHIAKDEAKEDEKPVIVQEDTETPEVLCPHCSMDINEPRFKVEDSDRDEWTRHILSGGERRFSKTYSAYGGRITFTLRSRTGLEDRDIDLGTTELTRTIESIADFQKIRVEMLKLQLAYSLDKIQYIDPKEPFNTRTEPITAPGSEDIIAAGKLNKSAAVEKYMDLLGGTPSATISLIVDKLIDFNALCTALTIEGLAADF